MTAKPRILVVVRPSDYAIQFAPRYDQTLRELGARKAALDVFDEEPLPEDSPFRKLDNAILTPHVAGGTIEARQRQGRYMVEEMQRFLAGEPLHFQVTREMLDLMA